MREAGCVRREARWLFLVIVMSTTLATSCGGGSATPSPEATAIATVRPASPSERAAALCASATLSVEASNLLEPDIIEISGLAASRENEGVLWGHNDSGDAARVFAFTAKGEPRAVYGVTGAEAIDWEDMAIGPGPQAGQDYLYLGDIGDNAAQRAEIIVYRAVEPDIETKVGSDIEGVERIVLRYPDAPHDAETLLIDPLSGDLVIITKEIATGNAGVYRVSAGALATGDATMERTGEIEKARLTPANIAPESASPLVRGIGYLPTGGDVSRDGALIAIRTYGAVFVWARNEGASIADALAGAPCEALSVIEPQGEAIALDISGDGYFTVSEGANPPLHHFSLE